MNESERQKVLIVDDSALNRSILADMLGEKYQIFEAGNGEDALKLIWKYGRDLSLVLLDLVMPKVNGFEVLEEMNRCGWMIQEIPVIVISTEKDNRSLNRAFDLGAIDFIDRPFNIYSVRRRVGNALSARRLEQRLMKAAQREIRDRTRRTALLLHALANTQEFQRAEHGIHPEQIYIMTRELLTELQNSTNPVYVLSTDRIDDAAMASALYPAFKAKLLPPWTEKNNGYLVRILRGMEQEKNNETGAEQSGPGRTEDAAVLQAISLVFACERMMHRTEGGTGTFRDAAGKILRDRREEYDPEILKAFQSVSGRLSVLIDHGPAAKSSEAYMERVSEERWEGFLKLREQ